jgi:hypothetical protein
MLSHAFGPVAVLPILIPIPVSPLPISDKNSSTKVCGRSATVRLPRHAVSVNAKSISFPKQLHLPWLIRCM